MAVLDCKECGALISSNAMACPHCGAPGKAAGLARSTSRHGLAWIILIIIVGAVIGVVVAKVAEMGL